MRAPAPIREPAGDLWTPGWAAWFSEVFECLRWKKSFNTTTTIDFGPVSAQAQLGATTTIAGVRQGDAVQVTPLADTSGVIYSGVVTADDTVTVYAKNFTAGAINPASTTFRIIVLQN